jgi:hypothetical protein
MPDNSQFYVIKNDFETRIERCWPTGHDYDCLLASNLNGSSSWDAERQEKNRLEPTDLTYRGYSCSVDSSQPFGIHYQEEISRAIDRVILKNMSVQRPPTKQGWSKEFIEEFLKANGLSDSSGWFSCPGFREIIENGGGETLTTTATTREILF